MILQRLAEHYDRMAAEGQKEIVQPGCSRQKISFCIVLNPDGSLNQFESLLRQEGKVKRATSMIVLDKASPPARDSIHAYSGTTLSICSVTQTIRPEGSVRSVHLRLRGLCTLHLRLKSHIRLIPPSAPSFVTGFPKKQQNTRS